MQQWRHLKKKGVSKPGPRRQFLTDLSKFINALQDKGHALILSLDSNEDSEEEGQFTKFITDNDLADAYKHMHPGSHPATYLRGHKRLDCMCMTPELVPAFWAIGYLPFHTGIYCRLRPRDIISWCHL
eukprot:14000189-Ditylum_brightwellii.AAC.1